MAVKCLCCGRMVHERGQPVTGERALRGYAFLSGMGYPRKDLLTKHREQLDFTTPGLAEWLEDHPELEPS